MVIRDTITDRTEGTKIETTTPTEEMEEEMIEEEEVAEVAVEEEEVEEPEAVEADAGSAKWKREGILMVITSSSTRRTCTLT